MANVLSNLIGGVTNTIYGEQPTPQMVDYNDPYFNQNRSQLAQGLAASQGRVGIEGQGGDPFRAGQLDLVQQLQAQAAGKGIPSLAEMQMRQASDRSLSNQMGAIASNRGIGAGLAQRLIGNQAADQGQQLAANAAQLRAQEQMNAQQQLAGALQQGRGGELQQLGLNDQMAQFFNQAMLGQSQQNVANRMGAQQGYQNALQANAAQEAGQRGQFLSALGQAAAYGALANANPNKAQQAFLARG